MKVSKVSRKSFVLYAGIFLCMLFFEEARLTPLLEREGANYPILAKKVKFMPSVLLYMMNLPDWLRKIF